MMIFILFIFWSNYLIHLNVAIKNHEYQSSLQQDSVEGDLSDLYERDDDYSDSLGNIYYLNTLVSHKIKKFKFNLQNYYCLQIGRNENTERV